MIISGKLPTVATRLCDPLAVTLPLHHSTPLEPPSSQETPARFGTLFTASLQAHQLYHLKYHSHSQHLPVYQKHTWVTNSHHTFYQKFTLIATHTAPLKFSLALGSGQRLDRLGSGLGSDQIRKYLMKNWQIATIT